MTNIATDKVFYKKVEKLLVQEYKTSAKLLPAHLDIKPLYKCVHFIILPSKYFVKSLTKLVEQSSISIKIMPCQYIF